MISSDKNMALSSKRPLCDDEPCQLASKKHLGHLDYNSEHRKLTEVIPSSRPTNLFSSVEESAESSWVFQGYQPLASHTTSDIQAVANRGLGVDIVPSLPDLSYCTAVDGKCNSFFADTTSRKEITGLSAIVSRTVQELEMDPSVKEYYESFIPAIDRYPRKLVAIGSRHQVEVPAWDLESSSTGSSRKASPSNQFPVSMVSADKQRDFTEEEEDQRLMGTCVIPMPDAQSSNQNAGNIGHGRYDCVCPDHGSLRCVRQHIFEQREYLKDTLGHDRFVELGFDNMGEEVSGRWSKEEEQLFQDVVYSNPASLNKDFWKELSVVFPTKSKGEIVNYYFNVFMLRRRAVQNRWDQSDIDSDNDEWQSDDDEFAVSEEEEDEVAENDDEEEDSGVESQAADVHVDIGCDQQAYDVWEDYCEEEEDDLDGYEEIGLGDACESHAAKGTRTLSPNNCKFNMIPAIGGGNQSGGVEDQDVQEESCMSDECYQIGVGSQSAAAADAAALKMRCPEGVVKAETENSRIPSINEYDLKGSAGIMAHGYLPENPCDLKMWDGNFLSVSKKDMDILPTCSMMKEIFGEESWNSDPLRGSPRIH